MDDEEEEGRENIAMKWSHHDRWNICFHNSFGQRIRFLLIRIGLFLFSSSLLIYSALTFQANISAIVQPK